MKRMTRKNWKAFRGAGLTLFFFAALSTMAFAMGSSGKTPRISKETLKGMLGNPDLVILDVRSAPSWEPSNIKIRGSIREEPDQVSSWAHKYAKDKTIVLYCT